VKPHEEQRSFGRLEARPLHDPSTGRAFYYRLARRTTDAVSSSIVGFARTISRTTEASGHTSCTNIHAIIDAVESTRPCLSKIRWVLATCVARSNECTRSRGPKHYLRVLRRTSFQCCDSAAGPHTLVCCFGGSGPCVANQASLGLRIEERPFVVYTSLPTTANTHDNISEFGRQEPVYIVPWRQAQTWSHSSSRLHPLRPRLRSHATARAARNQR
jgi:hypothetical protein